ncbi:MAG: hypothetical protein ACHQNV_02740 [Vicinamibacteria bacterium]
MSRRSSELAVALLATAVARVIVLTLGLYDFWDTSFVSHIVQDLRTWHDFFLKTRSGLTPYVDFSKEYPVGAGMLYWAMARFVDPEDLRQTVFVHGLAMGAIDLVNTALAYRLFREKSPDRALAFTLLFSLNFTTLLLSPIRFESALVLLVLLGYGAAAKGRPFQAVAFWSVGFWMKWLPAFFMAAQEWRALFVDRIAWRWLRAAGVFVAVAVLMNGPFVWAAWRHGSLGLLMAPWKFHMERPLYWDTLLGVGQIWLGPLPWERYGSWWTLGLVTLALAARPRLRLEYKGVLLCIAAILFNRIYSAQFHLWFYPFLLLGMITEGEERRRQILSLAVALDVLNVIVFPLSFTLCLDEIGGFYPYAARANGGPWTVIFSGAIVLRAVALVVLAALLLTTGDADASMGRRRLRG